MVILILTLLGGIWAITSKIDPIRVKLVEKVSVESTTQPAQPTQPQTQLPEENADTLQNFPQPPKIVSIDGPRKAPPGNVVILTANIQGENVEVEWGVSGEILGEETAPPLYRVQFRTHPEYESYGIVELTAKNQGGQDYKKQSFNVLY
ncbi:hypothetical protein GTN66_05670 [bacterium]|nr:hypothetical protein [bacterium]NIO73888.1 hypothetical protein [bacterium]